MNPAWMLHMHCYLVAWVRPTQLYHFSSSWLAGFLMTPCCFSGDVWGPVVVLEVDMLRLCLSEALQVR